MKQFNGYDDAKKNARYNGSTQLPAGAYVCEVINVKYDTFEWGEVITVAFDIAEGEFKGFFRNQFDNNTAEDKKWKGTARVNVPKDDGTEQDGWTKNAFARWTNSFEQSNEGYSWDWDENKWKGKKIGLVFRKAGTVIAGREVTYTEVAFPTDVKTVRDGKAPEAKFRARNGYTGNQNNTTPSTSNSFIAVPEGTDEEIPF